MLDGVDLRYVRLGRLELVRRVYVSVREPDWSTVPGVPSSVEVDERADSFDVRIVARHTSECVDVSWEGSITGGGDGRIGFTVQATAEQDALVNRVGFCVLHPWRETAGRPYRGAGPGGPVRGTFTHEIAPQRIVDGVPASLFPALSRLEVGLETGGAVVFDFEGDLFECEDQRNWGDASFKTYCGPLSRPRPQRLGRGERVRQAVSVRVAGAGATEAEVVGPALSVGGPRGVVPPLGVAADAASADLLRALGPAHVRHDVRLAEDWETPLRAALETSARARAPLEVGLFAPTGAAAALRRLRDALAAADVVRVLVAPADPGVEATPPELVAEVRRSLSLDSVPVGAGTALNFCELNRARPVVAPADAVFWPFDAQVHAADDLSILETPEAAGEQVRTARTFAGGKPLVVGPVTLGRGQRDARAAADLGAAWTLATVAHLVQAGAAAVTYGERLVEHDEPVPAFGVLAAICGLRGGELLVCKTTRPLELAGLAARQDGVTTVLTANLTAQPLAFDAPAGRFELGAFETTRIDVSTEEDA